MARTVSQFLIKNKTFPLNQKLTCANYGIYVAACAICHEQYVGQTANKFSTRWSAHRGTRNKPDARDDSDQSR